MPMKKRLSEFLDEHGVKYIIMVHSRAYTAQELAATLHVPGKMFAKTVILKADNEPLMAVVPASYKINLEKFKKIAGAQEVELASEEEFASLFPHCELGAMPPFGMLYGLPTFVDQSLTEAEEIYFNAATHTEVMKMQFADYQRLVEPVIASFAEHV